MVRPVWLPVVIFLVLALTPVFATFTGDTYVLGLIGRVMIFAIAALALDLLVGYGALVSFGHAAFIGLGAYAVGILSAHGINEALIALPVALAVSALGVDIRRLFMIVFGFGTMLAGFAGIMVAPILSVEPGMGDTILILAFVVIVIGGIGSIRGAFLAALIVGLVDTLGRSFIVDILRLFMSSSPARTVGPALASMLIYLLMAVVLYIRPTGLFPAKGR